MNGCAFENEHLPQIRKRLQSSVVGAQPHLMGACIHFHVECSCRALLEVLGAHSRNECTEAIFVSDLVRENVDHDPLVFGPSVGIDCTALMC